MFKLNVYIYTYTHTCIHTYAYIYLIADCLELLHSSLTNLNNKKSNNSLGTRWQYSG